MQDDNKKCSTDFNDDPSQSAKTEGLANKLDLDSMASKIDEHLDKGFDKLAIAELLGVPPEMLRAWLRERRRGMAEYELSTAREQIRQRMEENRLKAQTPGAVPQNKIFSQDAFVRIKRS